MKILAKIKSGAKAVGTTLMELAGQILYQGPR